MSNLHKFEKSSSIEHCDFDEASDTMTIRFVSGSTYKYPNCGRKHYDDLKAAKSPGSHFHKAIRALKSVKV